MGTKDVTGGEELEATFQNAKDAALRFLGYRVRSEAEVRRRLLRRYPPDLVERLISVLREQKYLDDPAFARQWRQGREQHRPRAKRLIRQELLRLGVADETVQKTLEDFDDGANAYQAGNKLARRLASRDCSEEEMHRRLWSHLRQRGFAYEEIRETVERLRKELGADLLHGQDNTKDDEQQPPEAEAKGTGQPANQEGHHH